MLDKIVCLDGYTLNPGDISWEPFERLGELEVHERTPQSAIEARIGEAPLVLTNKTPLSAQTLDRLPRLRYVGVLATGFNIVDVQAAARCNIAVTNVPTYGTDSVAQHVAALMLHFVRPIAVHDQAVHEGAWSTSPDWCFARAPIESLSGMTLGIVGVGRIGLAVARIAASFGMALLGNDTHWPDMKTLAGVEIEPVGVDELFRRSDIVSLHCPLTAENRHLVDARRLELMRRTAILINTSRGPLVDGPALAAALRAGHIRGAALDVLETEPPLQHDPLLSAPNCVLTPHIAWYARAARRRLMDVAADNLSAYLAGRRQNRVEPGGAG